MKNKTKSTFEVITLQTNEPGSMYSHWSTNLTMIIFKDGIKIELNSEEIRKLVNTLPRTIGGTY